MQAPRTLNAPLTALLLLVASAAGCGGHTHQTETVAAFSLPQAPGIAYSLLARGATISTIAGGGVGDGGLATQASLYTPQSVAVDRRGNIYIADTGHHRVRRVDKDTGIITTIAGTGIRGNSGDHGPAIKARLAAPHGLAFDSRGNLYISDTENQRIRMVDTHGSLHPVIGKKPGVSDRAMMAASLKDHDHSLMYASPGNGGEVVLAPPHHLVVDHEGTIYFSEMENNRIAKVDHHTGEVTVVAGVATAAGYAGDLGPATEASLMNPHSVAIDTDGNVYITDTFNHRIRMVARHSGRITTIAGSGHLGFWGDGRAATVARLAGPSGIAMAPDGSLYIADTDNRRIRRLTQLSTTSEWLISTVAGNGKRGSEGDGGPAIDASLVRPIAVTVDHRGNLYITDTGGQKIRKVDTSGMITTVAGNGRCCDTGDGQVATQADFTPPYDVAVDHHGHLYIADRDNHRIRRVDRQTGVIKTVAGNGERGYRGDGGNALQASLFNPSGVAIGADGSIYIADQGNHRIRKVDGTTGIITTIVEKYILEGKWEGPPTVAQLKFPTAVTIDHDDNLYISDTGNQRVLTMDREEIITLFAGSGTYGFSGDEGAATEANLANPTSLAVDEQGHLYIADSDNDRIRKVNRWTRTITTVAGNLDSSRIGDDGLAVEAGLRYPLGISIDQDMLYIADTGHHLVRAVSLKTGIITSMVGNGRPGRAGDGGAATKAVLSSPHGIAASGNVLYIADTDNRLIRRVDLRATQHP